MVFIVLLELQEEDPDDDVAVPRPLEADDYYENAEEGLSSLHSSQFSYSTLEEDDDGNEQYIRFHRDGR
jgi:hypothetical protein